MQKDCHPNHACGMHWILRLTSATFVLCRVNARSSVDIVGDAIIAHQQMKNDLICAYAPMTSRKSRSVSSSFLCNVDSLAEMLSLKCLNLRGRLCGCAQKWPKCCRPAKAPASIKTIKTSLVVIGLMCPHAVN